MLLEKMFYVVTMFAICRITEATFNSTRRNSLHKTITFATQLHDSDSRAAARIFVQGDRPSLLSHPSLCFLLSVSFPSQFSLGKRCTLPQQVRGSVQPTNIWLANKFVWPTNDFW